jgi:hypothetical protein
MGYSEIAAFTRAFTRRFGKSSGYAISTQSLASVLPSLRSSMAFRHDFLSTRDTKSRIRAVVSGASQRSRAAWSRRPSWF